MADPRFEYCASDSASESPSHLDCENTENFPYKSHLVLNVRVLRVNMEILLPFVFVWILVSSSLLLDIRVNRSWIRRLSHRVIFNKITITGTIIT